MRYVKNTMSSLSNLPVSLPPDVIRQSYNNSISFNDFVEYIYRREQIQKELKHKHNNNIININKLPFHPSDISNDCTVFFMEH